MVLLDRRTATTGKPGDDSWSMICSSKGSFLQPTVNFFKITRGLETIAEVAPIFLIIFTPTAG